MRWICALLLLLIPVLAMASPIGSPPGLGLASDLDCADCIGGTEIDESALAAVPTATALASNPTDCSANQFATTIADSGNLTCALPRYTDSIPGTGTDDELYGYGSVLNLDSLDDAAGVSDGSGASANPFPGDTTGVLTLDGVIRDRNDDQINYIYSPFIWNRQNANPNMPQVSVAFELSYQNGGTFLDSWPGYVEHYLQWVQNTHYVVFSSGGSGDLTMGDNVTFTGAGSPVCRVLNTDADLSNGATVRMWCVDHVAPASGATIASCTGLTGACGNTGTIASTPVSDRANPSPLRPWFYELHPQDGSVYWSQRRSSVWDGTAYTTKYWIDTSSGDNVIHIGKSGYDDTSSGLQARVSIPAHVSGAGTSPKAGDIVVDTTSSAAAGNAPRFEFGYETATSLAGGETSFYDRFSLSPISTACTRFTGTDTTTDDGPLDFAQFQQVMVVAVGCRGLTAASATDPLFSLYAGADEIQDTSTSAFDCDDWTSAETMTWETVNAIDALTHNGTANGFSDVHGSLASGEGLRVDWTTAATDATQDHLICIAYKTTPL